jgi:hypothetical protein
MRTTQLALAAVLIIAQGQVRADETGVTPGDPFAVTDAAASRSGRDVRQPADDRGRTLRFVNADRGGSWRLGDTVYVGRRPGDLGGFGVKWQAGANELALTHEGVGWRLRF